MDLPRLPMDYFDWLTWLNGSTVWEKLGVSPREISIIEDKHTLRKYAVGFIESEKISCRTKNNEFAVMFLIDGNFGWTHLRKREFEAVYGT